MTSTSTLRCSPLWSSQLSWWCATQPPEATQATEGSTPTWTRTPTTWRTPRALLSSHLRSLSRRMSLCPVHRWGATPKNDHKNTSRQWGATIMEIMDWSWMLLNLHQSESTSGWKCYPSVARQCGQRGERPCTCRPSSPPSHNLMLPTLPPCLSFRESTGKHSNAGDKGKRHKRQNY